MYCRRMDLNAGFLVSYSYCADTDTCLMDAWNYINRPCTGGWELGSDYPLTQCNPNSIACPGFNSTTAEYGTYTNQTVTLAQGAGCNITIDATQALARVVFDETSFLGIDYEKAKIGEVITIPSGKEAIIPIYNAA